MRAGSLGQHGVGPGLGKRGAHKAPAAPDLPQKALVAERSVKGGLIMASRLTLAGGVAKRNIIEMNARKTQTRANIHRGEVRIRAGRATAKAKAKARASGAKPGSLMMRRTQVKTTRRHRKPEGARIWIRQGREMRMTKGKQ